MSFLAASDKFVLADLIMVALVMLICGVPYVVVIGFIAARKGKSVPLFCLLVFIPIVNVVTSVWLASLTDAALARRLSDLERRIPRAI